MQGCGEKNHEMVCNHPTPMAADNEKSICMGRIHKAENETIEQSSSN